MDVPNLASKNKASLGQLLATLTAIILFAPLVHAKEGSLAGIIFSCVIIVSLISALSTLIKTYSKVRCGFNTVGGLLILTFMIFSVIKLPGDPILFVLLSTVLFHLSVMAVLIRHLFSKTVDQSEKLLAAINFYLLTGITFSYLFIITNMFQPHSFKLDNNTLSSWPDYLYFSFVTLTTLGYGEIVPQTPFSQSLSILEAVIGVLSPTVMIARFVTAKSNNELKQ